MDSQRFQFGLRKMLLWTVVVALWLGLCKWLAMELPGIVMIMSWLVVVAGARLMWNVRVAFLVSAAWLPIFMFAYFLWGAVSGAGMMLLMTLVASFWVLLIVAIVEVSVRLVNWADNFMASKNEND